MLRFSAPPNLWMSVIAPVRASFCLNPALALRCAGMARITMRSVPFMASGVAGEQETHGKGNSKHPLANAAPGQDIVHEQRRGVDHAPGAAARAKPAMLATECNESFGLTVHAAHAQESVAASGRQARPGC